MVRARAVFVASAVLLSPAAASARQADDPWLAVRLEAQPRSLDVSVGESVPLQGLGLDAAGRRLDVPVRVGEPRRAVEVSDGTVRGVVAGTYEIVATLARPGAEPLMLTIPVTVHWPPVAAIEVYADTDVLYVGTAVGIERLGVGRCARPWGHASR